MADLALALKIKAATEGTADIEALRAEISRLLAEAERDVENPFTGLSESAGLAIADVSRLFEAMRELEEAERAVAEANRLADLQADATRVSQAFNTLGLTTSGIARGLESAEAAALDAFSNIRQSALTSANTVEAAFQGALGSIRSPEGLVQLRTELDQAVAAGRLTEEQFRRLVANMDDVERTSRGTAAGLEDVRGRLNETTQGLLEFAGIELGVDMLGQLREMADQYANLSARLEIAVGATGNLQQAQQDVLAVAQATYQPLETVAGLYEKITAAQANLNIQQAQVADLTQVVSQGMQLGGQSANTQAEAINQLSQALATGQLRGEEFNSVNEASPRLMKALADGLNVPIGKLRELAETGKLTSDEVVKALLAQKNVVDQEYSKLPLTLERAMTQFTNAVQVYTGQANASLGVTNVLAQALTFVSQNLGALDAILAGVAAGGAVRLIQTLTGLVQGLVAGTAAAGGLTAALTLLGGPAGVIGLVAAGLVLLVGRQREASTEMAALNKTIDEQKSKLDELSENQLKGLIQKQQEALELDRQAVVEAAKKIRALEDEKTTITDLNEFTEANLRLQREAKTVESELVQARAGLDTQTKALAKRAQELEDTQRRLTEVQGGATVGAKVQADTFVSLTLRLAEAEQKAGQHTAQLQGLTEATAAQTAASQALTAQLGTETAQAQSAAQAAQTAADAARFLVAAKEAEVTAAVNTAAAIEQEINLSKNQTEEKKKALDTARENLIAKTNEAQAATANAEALQIEAAALAGVATAQKDNTQTLADWGQALTTAQEKLVAIQTAQAEGKATQADLTAAQLEAVKALAAYKTALDDAVAASDAAIDAAGRETSISEQTVQVKIDQKQATLDLAKARGDEASAARAAIDLADLEVKQGQATVAGLKTELAALRENLDLKRRQLAADSELTDAEVAQLDALADAVRQKELAIESAKAHVDSLKAEAEATRNVAEATETQTQSLYEQELAQRNARVAADETEQSLNDTAVAFIRFRDSAVNAFDIQGIATYRAAIEIVDKWLARARESIEALAGDAGLPAAVREAQSLARNSLEVSGYMDETVKSVREELVQALASAQERMQSFVETEQEALKDRQEALEDYKAEGDDLRQEELRHAREIAALETRRAQAQAELSGPALRDALAAIEAQIVAENKLHDLKMGHIEAEKTAQQEANQEMQRGQQISEARQYFEDLNTTKLDGLKGELGGVEALVDRLIAKTRQLAQEAAKL
jgi:tape measure domain-containing protein